MFCGQGDVISNFTEYIFKRDFESTIKEPAQINNCFDMAIRASLADTNPLKELFYFTSKKNEIWGINAFNMEEHFDINYRVSYPLTLLFDEQSMAKYNRIFFFLIRLRRINDLLKIIWDFTNSAELRRSSLDVYTKIRKVQFLRQKMQQFINNLMQYILNEIVDKLWTKFHQNLHKIVRFEDILILHKDYLNAALDKCFILKKDSRVGELMKHMLSLIQELYKLCIHLEFSDEVRRETIKSPSFMSKINTLDKSFDQYSVFFYKLIKSLAEKGMFKELFLRIDFNGYYANGEMLYGM